MSSFRRAPLRSPKRVVLALSAALAMAIVAAPAAQASFTLTQCAGSSTQGAGASFQNVAHQGWLTGFQSSDGPFSCNNPSLNVVYTGGGSGAGRTALGANATGVRDPITRFAGSDNGPSITQRAQMENGPVTGGIDNTDADDTDLLVLPAGVGAVTVPVNFPDGCAPPTASLTDSGSSTKRFKLNSNQVEEAFSADSGMNTWGELVPNIGTTATPDTPDAGCAAKPLIRIVRQDNSGTTYVFKYWMFGVSAAANTDGTWETAAKASPNTVWPTEIARDSDGTCNAAGTNICNAVGAGNNNLLPLLAATDGGIGYSDLAESRTFGFNVSSTSDDTFWVPVTNDPAEDGNGTPTGVAREPSLGSGTTGFTSGSAQGSNCGNAVFLSLPFALDPGSDWSSVRNDGRTTTGGGTATSAYGGCGMTFLLAFQDNAPAWGATAIEQARARTVKDYLNYIVNDAGQATLPLHDYGVLPSNLQDVSQAAVPTITFDAAGLGGGGSGGGGTATTTGGGGGVATVSNAFTIGSAAAKKGKNTVALTLQLPGAGKVAITGKSGKTTVGTLTATTSGAGATKLTFKLNSKGKKLLKKKKKLKVSLSITYTPTGGTAKTSTKTVTVKK